MLPTTAREAFVANDGEFLVVLDDSDGSIVLSDLDDGAVVDRATPTVWRHSGPRRFTVVDSAPVTSRIVAVLNLGKIDRRTWGVVYDDIVMIHAVGEAREQPA